jgi:vancomycin resistance protein YoaR
MASRSVFTTSRLWVLPSLAIPILISAVAWTTNVSSRGDEVAPNVTFAGTDVSGLSAGEVAEVVREREIDFLATPVIVSVGDLRRTLTAEETGFVYDYDATLADVLSAHHGDGPWSEFWAWADTPLNAVNVADHYSLDTEAARERLGRDDFVIEAPVEPVLNTNHALYIRAVAGSDGVGVDVDHAIHQLGEADVAGGTVEIKANEMTIHPTVTDDTAADIAMALNRDTQDGFLVVFDGTTKTLVAQQFREHVVSTVTDGAISLSVDVDGFQKELETMFTEPAGDFIPPVMEVVDDQPTVMVEGHAPDVCCSRESIARMGDEILNDPHAFYDLDPRPEDDEAKLAWVDGSAITEPVSEFTTHHQCCQNRVTNIHVIADAVSGLYLFPGQTFSLNKFVGPRTLAKGYLVDGAIRGGYHVNEVGGGVSQFTTTLFNAAFYAGLDLDEYQSHSVYFSRYPFGREATLSNPRPDLVLTNSTDYPVLVWSTYDGTSITVTIYSTKNVVVEEAEPRIFRRGLCRHTEIDRQRTFSDGRVAVDTIVANYRPGDGLDCSGNPIPHKK